jgi:hypothetical protein
VVTGVKSKQILGPTPKQAQRGPLSKEGIDFVL